MAGRTPLAELITNVDADAKANYAGVHGGRPGFKSDALRLAQAIASKAPSSVQGANLGLLPGPFKNDWHDFLLNRSYDRGLLAVYALRVLFSIFWEDADIPAGG